MDKLRKLVHINLPGATLLVDWRACRLFWYCYRVLLNLFDIADFLSTCIMACVINFYRFFVPKPLKDLRGHLALVTGSGNGVGAELCVELGRLGAVVVGLDINDQGNSEIKNRLAGVGCKYHVFHCDLRKKSEIDLVASKIINKIGIPTLLINNAAVTIRHPFLHHTEEELIELFQTNVVGPMLLTQKFLTRMLCHPKYDYQIVGISSIVGLLGTPNMVPYSATKFAMTGFMEGLHYELMSSQVNNISLTTVHPFLISDNKEAKPRTRYQELIGMVSVEETVKNILDGIRRNEKEVFIPKSLHMMARLFRVLPTIVQRKFLEILEFGTPLDVPVSISDEMKCKPSPPSVYPAVSSEPSTPDLLQVDLPNSPEEVTRGVTTKGGQQWGSMPSSPEGVNKRK